MSLGSGRNRSIERLLKAATRGTLTHPPGGCLDAEKLVAWSSRQLPPREAAAVEVHLSMCARCQAAIAAFARSNPAAQEASMRRAGPIAWLVPGMAAAYGLFLIWQATSNVTPQAPPSAPTAVASRESKTSATSPTAQTPNAASPRAETKATSPAPARPQAIDRLAGARTAPSGQTRGGLPEPARSQPSSRAAIDAVSPLDRSATPPASPPPPTPLPQSPPPPAPAAPAVVSAPLSTPASGRSNPPPTGQLAVTRQARTAESQIDSLPLKDASRTIVEFVVGGPAGTLTETVSAGRGGAAAPSRAAGGGGRVAGAGRGGAGGRGGQAERVTDASGAGAAAATSPIRWRILDSISVERSLNGGATWDIVPIDPPAVLIGGVAPSARVCWLIGRGGVVLLAVDGAHFERVRFPVTADLSSVRATGAREATVTTVDGREFTTTDSGLSWRLQDFVPPPF